VTTPALSSLVAAAEQGDRAAADTLFSTLYDELHRMARRELARRGSGVTLTATALLHEAYLDISARDRAAFPDRHRFMAYGEPGASGSHAAGRGTSKPRSGMPSRPASVCTRTATGGSARRRACSARRFSRRRATAKRNR